MITNVMTAGTYTKLACSINRGSFMYPTAVPSVPRHYRRRPRARPSLSVAIVRIVHPYLVELVVNNTAGGQLVV